ncbi:MAG TPA: type II secretion system secretin GspD [Polyangiaceae bacterium]|nr:type II secretion system secretin GspD [Polyangiaceae bacterium]
MRLRRSSPLALTGLCLAALAATLPTVARAQDNESAAEDSAPAKRQPGDPPGLKPPPPNSMESIAKAVDTPYRPKPGGHRIKFNLEDADLAELVNHISGLTGKRFIYGSKVRKVSITVVSPTPVTLAEAYEAFLSVLQANGLTVVPAGEFLKIVDSAGVTQSLPPLYPRASPVPETDAYVTRLYRLKSVSANEVSNLLSKFKSKEGDITVYEPGGLIIITDTGAHVRRLIRLIEEVDVGSASARMWIEPIHYGDARDYAKQVNDIFQLDKGTGGGGLLRVLADEQTNALIIVGSNEGYLRLLEFLKRVDTAPAAEGRIHVLSLQHAVADELAQTLTRMLSGTAAAGGGGGRAGRGAAQGAAAAAPAAGGGGGADGLFEGAVRVTSDKATNSLIVTSSTRDYAQLRLVIDHLDRERRQVFIEAVIMDLSADRSNTLGISYHGGATAGLFGQDESLILGGFNAVDSITGPTQLQALALGVRGPDLPGTEGRIPLLPPGISIPAFGIALNAIATSQDTNVLSTPHIIAMDNTEAEINVGENIALQTNQTGGNLAGLAPLLGGGLAGGQGVQGLGALGALGALGGAPRQDVGTKIKITPHINRNNQVRLEIEEEISEQGATTGDIGAVSIVQRNAKTTVMVDDQQTVVIGGLMRDTKRVAHTKIPLLGDLPVLGFLFRNSVTQTEKTNLLLILTPYVIQSQEDLRKVFTRKMQERQEFLDRYFVFNGDWQPPRDYARANGLVEEIRQAFAEMAEQRRLELEGMPSDAKTHQPTEPLDLPVDVSPGQGGGAPGAPAAAPGAAPATPRSPTPRRSRRTSQLESESPAQPAARLGVPLVINSGARSVPMSAVSTDLVDGADAVERIE